MPNLILNFNALTIALFLYAIFHCKVSLGRHGFDPDEVPQAIEASDYQIP